MHSCARLRRPGDLRSCAKDACLPPLSRTDAPGIGNGGTLALSAGGSPAFYGAQARCVAGRLLTYERSSGERLAETHHGSLTAAFRLEMRWGDCASAQSEVEVGSVSHRVKVASGVLLDACEPVAQGVDVDPELVGGDAPMAARRQKRVEGRDEIGCVLGVVGF
jgi:hypothetical protein